MKRLIYLLLACVIVLPLWGRASDGLQDKLQKRVTLQLNQVPIEQVISLLSTQHQLNFVMANKVQGKVTLTLKDVALKDVLTAVLLPLGAHYVVQGNLIIVKSLKNKSPADLTTRVFDLRYQDASKLVRTIKPLISDRGKAEVLPIELTQQGSVQRSEMLVVQDFPENLARIAAVVAELDQPIQQIHIEVRLVETALGAEQRVGLNLPTEVTVKSTGAENTLPFENLQGTSQTTDALSGWYELPAAIGKLNLGILSVSELQATLSALAQDNSTRLVSSPSVIAMDNHKAVIKIGTSVPIPQVSRGISGDLFSYEEKEVNMYLEVIPRINQGDTITLTVHPILEEIVGYVGPSDFPQPIISRREVQTQVMVTDSQTVVIGGLIKETTIETVKKMWLLGDIPLFKYLFRHKQKKKQKTNLLIFITPRIVRAGVNTGGAQP